MSAADWRRFAAVGGLAQFARQRIMPLAQPPAKPEWERLADARERLERLERLEREHAAARRYLRETDGIKPPYGPDPYVFGPVYERAGVQHPTRHCPACGAGWSIYAGAECWACKPP